MELSDLLTEPMEFLWYSARKIPTFLDPRWNLKEKIKDFGRGWLGSKYIQAKSSVTGPALALVYSGLAFYLTYFNEYKEAIHNIINK